MTEDEMYLRSFGRPRNFFELSAEDQWNIDKTLGILDWVGDNLTEEQKERYFDYYN